LWRQKAGDNERVFPNNLKTVIQVTIVPALQKKAWNGKGSMPVEEARLPS